MFSDGDSPKNYAKRVIGTWHTKKKVLNSLRYAKTTNIYYYFSFTALGYLSFVRMAPSLKNTKSFDLQSLLGCICIHLNSLQHVDIEVASKNSQIIKALVASIFIHQISYVLMINQLQPQVRWTYIVMHGQEATSFRNWLIN